MSEDQPRKKDEFKELQHKTLAEAGPIKQPKKEPKKTDLFTTVLILGTKIGIGVTIIGSIMGIGYEGYKYNKIMHEPKSVYTSPSLYHDDDCIPDATLQLRNGYKIPLFGHAQPDGTIEYITANEKIKVDPHCVIDFAKLEKRVNDPHYKPIKTTKKK